MRERWPIYHHFLPGWKVNSTEDNHDMCFSYPCRHLVMEDKVGGTVYFLSLLLKNSVKDYSTFSVEFHAEEF